jgi:hypothetical protein
MAKSLFTNAWDHGMVRNFLLQESVDLYISCQNAN